jgi:hypothetical protein
MIIVTCRRAIICARCDRREKKAASRRLTMCWVGYRSQFDPRRIFSVRFAVRAGRRLAPDGSFEQDMGPGRDFGNP